MMKLFYQFVVHAKLSDPMFRCKKVNLSLLKMLFFGIFLMLGTYEADASHALGGDLTYECVGPNQYRVTLALYRDCNGVSYPGSRTIRWSGSCGSGSSTASAVPGSTVDITPNCPGQPSSCSGGGGSFGVEQRLYQTTITIPAGCTNITFSWDLCCRNNAITTINGSPSMYTESTLSNMTLSPCNSSPIFLNPPSAFTCVNDSVFYNHGAFDPDGDQLQFSLIPCQSGPGSNVSYVGGYSGTQPLGAGAPVSIDPNTGAIAFFPNSTEVAIFCVLVEEYRNGVLIGSVVRDIQFRVLGCTNQSPTVTGINGGTTTIDYTATACFNTQLCFDVTGSDPNGNNIVMYWNQAIPGAQFTAPNNYSPGPVTGQFCWTPTASDVGLNTFTVTIEDDACPLAGSNVFTYNINVIPNPNDPVDAGPDVQICQGDTTTLTAFTTASNVQSYSWSPVAPSTLSNPNSPVTQAFPTTTTTYTVTLLYTDGCTSTDQVTVTVVNDPPVSVFPALTNVCAGASITLTASTSVGGMDVQWFDHLGAPLGPAVPMLGTSSQQNVTVPGIAGTYIYTVIISDPITSCTSSEIVTLVVGAPPVVPECVNIYVDNGALASAAGTQLDPTSLVEALNRASCNNSVIKLDTGYYEIDSTMLITSFLTIEGGFQKGNLWTKTAEEGATIVNRTTANPDGVVNAQRLVAFAAVGSQEFRLQDFTITTDDANAPGMSTYGVHLQSPSNYTIARMQILPGDAFSGGNGTPGAGRSGAPNTHAMDGKAGVDGFAGALDPVQGAGGNGGDGGFASATKAGGFGGTAGGGIGSYGGDGADVGGATTTQCTRNGGSGGGGGSGGCSNCTNTAPGKPANIPNTGYDGGQGGRGGSSGPAGTCPSNPYFGCAAGFSGSPFGYGIISNGGVGGASNANGTNGVTGATGEPGCPGAAGPAGDHLSGFPFWTPGSQGQTGEHGEAGSGGGGGGGSGNSGINAGNGGGGGGGGGAGGAGGTGGFGGGASFGVYIVDNGVFGSVIDCRIAVGSAGLGGVGGIGGTGGNSGGGGAASTVNGIISGRGGDGGAGGNGGNGGDGQPGIAQNVYVGGTSVALDVADSTHNFIAEPDIIAENVNCTNATVQFSDPTIGSGQGFTTWDFDVYTNNTVAGLETGTNNPDTTQYTSIGRYTIGHAGFNYEGFHNIAFDGAFKPTIMSSANMLSPDTFQLCVGDFATFSSDRGADTIIWEFNGAIANPGSVQNVPSTQFNNPGFYEVTLLLITDCCGDSPMDTAYIFVDPTPNPTGSGDISMCRGDSGTLTVSGLTALDTVIWTPTSDMNMITSSSVRVAPTVSTTYTASVYSVITAGGQTRLSCPVSLPFNVTIQNPPEISLTATDVLCEDDGTATVTIANGTGPYRYEWSSGETAQIPVATHSVINKASGVFTVTVTDLGTTNSCDTSATIFIFPSSGAPDVTVAPTDVTCNGDSDGQAVASVINGQPPFDYVWSGPTVIPATIDVTTQTATGLAVGNYRVTATDANGCTDTISFSIGEPPLVTINTISTTDPVCVDGNDGDIQIEGVGGTGAFTYSWNDGTTTTTNSTGMLSSIGIGTYQITVTDANSCDAFTTITLTPQNVINTAIAITSPVPCNGDSATIEVNASGGDGNYTYTWTGGSSSLFPTNQDLHANAAAGVYAVTVTDGNGCTTSTGVTVTEPTIVTATITSSVSVACFGDATGQATAAGSGGNGGPYSFQWDAGTTNQTTATATGLSANITYFVTVTDGSGNCSDVTSVTLAQPATAVTVNASVTSNFNGAEISCFGADDGEITAIGSNGTPGYTYLWSDSQTDAVATGLVDGTYTITVTDANLCTDQFTITITEPTQITTTLASSVSVACFGDSTGSATANPIGGTGAYTYQWDANAFGQTNQTAIGLPEGTYTVTASDVNLCTGTMTVGILEPASAITASVVLDNQTTCNGTCDGQATASAGGGTVTSGYTFLWPATAANQTTATATGLCAGTYTVSVSDNNSCTDTVSVVVTEPTAVTATISSNVSVSCFAGTDGQATVTGSGGNGGAYSFQWDAGTTSQTTATATGLAQGTYFVTVTDVFGNCTAVTSATILQPADAVSVTTNVFSNYNGAEISCFGASDGSIAAVPTGGTPLPGGTYNYSWSTGPNTDTLLGQAAGAYTVTVADANGCTATSSITVSQPSAITTSITSNVSVACFGDSTGSATAAATGGTGTKSFTWDANAFSQTGTTAGGLPAGTYTVSATDLNGCTTAANTTITQPGSAVSASVSPSTSITCNGASNGAATASGSGGTVAGAYTFTWDANAGNQTTATATGLAAGIRYLVTVADDNSCTDTVSIVLSQPTAVTATISSNVSVSCNTGTDGQATVVGSGGNGGPYSFQWDAGTTSQTTATATGLAQGTYFVTVTDVFGNCEGVTSVTIQEPATAVGVSTSITSNYNGADVSCFGASNGSLMATPSGGIGASYTYSWSTGATTATLTGRAAGVYTVTVADINSCTATSSITVTQPDAVTTTIASSVSVACFGASTGQATATATGGTGASYIFTWDDVSSQTGATALGLPAGNYTVTGTDINGCIGTAVVTITQPASAVTATATQTANISCNGFSDGQATATGSGGTVAGAYSFLWDANAGNQTTAIATGLSAGGITYGVTVTDDNGCSNATTVTLTEPTTITATISSNISVSCNGGSTGQATAAGAGGTVAGAYTFQWDAATTSQTTATATGLAAGTYFVTVSDDNGCSSVVSTTIDEPATAVTVATGVASNYNGAQVRCNGSSDGIVVANASGGTVAGNYVYTWSPALPGTDTIYNAPAGIYAVTVTDDNGCTATSTTTITQPSAVVATIPTSVSVDCNGDATGSATAVAAGGTTPPAYTFLWSANTGGQNTATATALVAGNYTVTVVDANGCTDVESVVIGQPASAVSVSAVVNNNTTCNGAADGQATASGVGGTGTITYLWTPTSQTTAIATGLAAGQHIVIATDANNCTSRDTVMITEPTAVVASISAQVNVACFGDATGTATAAGSGGTAAVNYTFLWDNAAADQTTATATGLAVGSYNVTVSDDNGCSDVTTVNILEPTFAVAVGTSVTSSYNGAQISCNGAADGEATANGSGGTGTLSYQWDVAAGSQTTAIATGLAAGNYCVIVTDANSCTATSCVTVSEPNSIAPSIANVQNVNCRGASTGEITAAATGGTTISGYTFQWDAAAGSQTTATAIGLIAGNYCVTITDANGCTSQICETVTEPASNLNLGVSVTSNYNGQNVSCFGADDGEATAVAAGGTGTITYAWNVGGQTGPIATGLADGAYCVVATDALGCSESMCITLTEPTQITISTVTTVDVTCKDGSTGLATVTANGGTAPVGYTFLWDNAQTGATATGLADGIYSVTATDINGCIGVGTVIIDEPASAINATAVVTSNHNGQDISCFGANDGEATASAIGGTVAGNYTFQWSSATGGQTTAIAGGLVAGSYIVTVSDDNGCTDTAQVTLTQPSPVLAIITDSVDVKCFGDATGSLTAAGTGGTGVYTYQWEVNALNQTTATATGLAAGSYNVTVTDINGCSSIGIGVVDQPNGALDVDINITSNYNGQQISCNGAADGTAEAVITDGTAPYIISWSVSGNTNAAIANLGPGTYVVTATDANGCKDTAQITLTEPSITAVNIIAQTDVDCRGASTGTATAVGTGGIGNFKYLWSHSGQTTATAIGLPAGAHSVTATDDNNCSAVTTVVIDQPTTTVLANASVTSDYNGAQISCNGATDGEALASGTGGTVVTAADYTYQWSGSANSQLTALATGLPAGSHTVTVSDLNGCSNTVTVTITEPTIITATITTTNNVVCAGDATGSATAAGSGGTAPLGYTFQWDAAAGGQTTATATGLAAGSYNVTVNDANGCNQIAIAVITAPAAAVVATGSVISNYNGFDISCNGSADGVAMANVTGGNGSYTYQWSAGYTTATATGLADGTYTVTVMDGNGCTDTTQVTLTEPAQIMPIIVSSSDVNCFGDATGSATVGGTGGTGAGTYGFLWNAAATSQTTAMATGLAAGLYEVTVTDANGCFGVTNVTISQPTGPVNPNAIVTSNYNGSEISCNGEADGIALASATGGTVAAAYTYQWSGSAGSQATAVATGLPAGTHSVTVSDDLGCSSVAQVTVSQPSVVVAQITSTIQNGCAGNSNGVATAAGTGGTVATVYNFLWEDGQTTATATGLSAGSYNVTVSDDNNCQSIATAVITTPASAVTANVIVTSNYNGQQISCNSATDGIATATVAGGTGTYTFIWSAAGQTTATATGLGDGTYTVSVTDGNGCMDVAQVTLVEPTLVVASISSSVNVNCFGQSTGSATVSTTGGTTPYTFQWSANAGSQTTATATGLAAGLYSVTTTDANNCTDITTITINQPASAINASALVTSNYNGAEISCNGSSNGEATASATGGTIASDYVYQWSASATNQATAIATGLAAGTHTVIITDDLGCADTTTVVVTEPNLLVATMDTVINVSCSGDSTGLARVKATGGTAPSGYTFLWEDGQTTATATGLAAGSYNVTVSDLNDCESVQTAVVTAPATSLVVNAAVISNYNGSQVSCNGLADGEALASVAGGSAPYQYIWSVTGQTTTNATGLSNGTYTVQVTDFNGCTATASVTVTEPGALTATISNQTNNQCKGDAQGTATLAGVGGTPAYTFIWDANAGGQTTATATGLAAGIYAATISDQNSCNAVIIVNITEPANAVSGNISVVSNYNGSQVSCHGAADAVAVITATGGTVTTDYTYLWSTGVANDTLANIGAGTYCVTVTDDNNCATDTCVIISNPPLLTVNTTVTNTVCFGDGNGTATAIPTGGTVSPSYTYLWDAAAISQTTATATGLAAGSYNVTVADNNGCKSVGVAIVGGPSTPLTVIANVGSDYNGQDISCNGAADGFAVVSAAGGAGGYTYLWSVNGETNDTLFNLSDGMYTVTVRDQGGCTATQTVTLTDPAVVVGSIAITDASCNGGGTGTATATAVGGTGTGTYDFLWSTSETTSTIMAPVGLVSVTVTDRNNCTDVTSATINQPASSVTAVATVISNYNGADVSCNGANDGSVTVAATGGTPATVGAGYTYQWSVNAGGSVTDTVYGLDADVYTVVATDSLGCTASASVTITEPTQIAASISSTVSVSCKGQATGRATAAGAGGTGTYSFQWDAAAGGQTTATANNLAAGSYNVTVTDANGCNQTAIAVITEPASLLDATAMITSSYNGQQISCNGAADGEITATVTGGTPFAGSPSYLFNWNTSTSTTNVATGLVAGQHCIEVIDANGCRDTACVTLIEPAAIVAVADTVINVTCNGASNGSATVVATGGTGAGTYSFQWDAAAGGQTTATVNNLVVGSYCVTVSDLNACFDVLCINVTEPATPVSATATVVSNYNGTDVSCAGATDGIIVATGAGGTPSLTGTGYTYLWDANATNQSTDTAFNVGAGTYQVTITDNNGCTDVASVTVTEPTAIAATITASSDASCNGMCDGTATVATSGGTGTYTFDWSNGGTTAIVNGLCAGSYQVTVTDANGCSDITSVVIGEPAIGVTANATITSNFNGSDVSCNGSCDGEANVVGLGGTIVTDYTYNWGANAANQATATATALCAGTYVVSVTDDNGCMGTDTVIIVEPAVVSATLVSSVSVSCGGGADGSATITGTGGTVTTGYTYLWSANAQTTATATGLSGGNHTVTISDNNGCSGVFTINIPQPANPLIVTPSVATDYNGADISCNGAADGAITVAVSGGIPGYNITWFNNASADTITNLGPGTYMVTVSDQGGCTTVDSVTVTEPNQLAAAITAQNNVKCFGDANGSVTIEATAGTGTPGYTYSISGTPTFPGIFTGLAAGNYTITVADLNFCTTTVPVTITEPATAISATATVTSNYNGAQISCMGANDGTAMANPTGGTAPYTYSWSFNSQTTQTATGLGANTYNVTIMDSLGCTTSAQVTLTEPTAITATLQSTTNVLCAGQPTGTATIQAQGGTGSYTFDLGFNSTTTTGTGTVSNIPAGSYTATVTDANGCSTTVPFIITEPQLLTLNASTTSNYSGFPISCSGACDGAATAVAAGGPVGTTYNFLWSTGQTDFTATGLCEGTYTVTVTDANGCNAVDTVTLTPPNPISASISSQINVGCNGAATGSVEVVVDSGGVPSYTFNIGTGLQPNGIFTGLAAGSYTVTVTDANNCFVLVPVTISQGSSMSVTTSRTPNTSVCNSNGTATVTVTGGTPLYTYQWDAAANNQIAATATGLSSGTYGVTITDANGCTTTASVTVIGVSSLEITVIDTTMVSCFGVPDGTFEVASVGGSGNHVYSIDGGNTFTNDVLYTNLPAATYQVIVRDASGCEDTVSVTITEPTQLQGLITNEHQVSCFGGNDGYVVFTGVNGTPGYTYSFDGGAFTTTDSIGSLIAGNYTVIVKDANGCTTNIPVDILQPSVLVLTVDTAINPSCNGAADGRIELIASGGGGVTANPNYTYSIDGINYQASGIFTGLSAGGYTVYVKDAEGCITTKTVILSQPTLVAATASVVANPAYNGQDVSCNGAADGSATVVASGGTGIGYTYIWSPGGMTTNTVTGLSANIAYTVTVADANGCTVVDNVTLTQPAAINAIATATAETCPENNDGTISVATTGGTVTGSTQYTYDFGNGLTTQQSITGVAASATAYIITVTDANGCTTTATATVTEPDTLLVTNIAINSQNSCNGDADASVTVIATGGTVGLSYNYLWNPTGATTDNATGLAAGTYTVTVSNANGCQDTASVVVTEPDAVIITLDADSANCNGAADGAITVTATGGTGTYEYSIDGGTTYQASNIFAGLTAGTYTIVAKDANDCPSISQVITVYDNSSIATTTAITSNYNGVAISCAGEADGAVNVTATGGSGNGFTYLWSNAGETTTAVTGLTAGQYTVTVTDITTGCEIVDTVNLTEPSTIVTTIVDTTNVGCAGNASGRIELAASGGTPVAGYNYEMTGLPANQTGVFENLVAGTYTITVTDANDCEDVVVITLGESNPLTIDLDIVNIACGGIGQDNGQVIATVTGGSPFNNGGYIYSWNSNGNGTNSIAGLAAGNYTVTVTDKAGCTVSASALVQEPTPLTLTYTTIDATCSDSNGTIDITVTGGHSTLNGGTGNYLYSINGGDSTQLNGNTATFTQLPGQVYSIVVFDTTGQGVYCADVATVDLASTSPLELQTLELTNPSCANMKDGSMYVEVTGGSGNYTVAWNIGNVQPDTMNPIAPVGPNFKDSVFTSTPYSVTITDNDGCSLTIDSLKLTAPDSLDVAVTKIQDVQCFAGNDGAAFVTATGGDTANAYIYVWSNGSTTDTVTNFEANILPYWVTVTDANGCQNTDSVLIEEPSQPLVAAMSGDSTTCYGSSDGTITVDSISGGTPFGTGTGADAYQYSFATAGPYGSTAILRQGLPAGVYTVYVQDSNGCSFEVDSVVIRQPVDVVITAHTDQTIRMGESVELYASVNQLGVDSAAVTWRHIDPLTGDTSAVLCQGCMESFVPDASLLYTDAIFIVDLNNGCADTSIVNITVDRMQSIFVPNAFSPNGDGINDIFVPYASVDVEKVITFQVYDRWGERVYESADFQPGDLSNGWDGMFKGKKMNPAVFVYYVEYQMVDGTVEVRKGDVTLIR